MKSLQVLTPNRKCIFNCPFCISKTHSHNNQFPNNYELNKSLWVNNFIQVLVENQDLKTIVITGTNEPMQDQECIYDIIQLTRKYRKDIQIELQTRYYQRNSLFNSLDVVAFSISDYKFLSKIPVGNYITRYVIILTDTFNDKTLADIINAIPIKVEQLTFKVLHDSNNYNKELDKWVNKHRVNTQTIKLLKEDIVHYHGDISILFDEDCMNATDRYMVFREDGYLYENFETKIKK